MSTITERLEYLRHELRAERISMGELHELQSLADHIEPGDVELLEAAGVPEFPEHPILQELRKRVYVLQTRDPDPALPMLFADRAVAHAWADEHLEHGRWHVTDMPVWREASA